MTKKVVLFSGGIDSFCLVHKVKPDLALYFDIGLPENKKEIEYMKKLKLPCPLIIDDRFKLGDQKLPNEVLPFRNIFLIIGALYYGSKIYLGATSSSTNRDKNPTFAGKLEDLVKYVAFEESKNPPHLKYEDIEILMPFKDKTKSQFLAEYLEDGGSVDELLATRSCYDSKEVECGKCQSCIRKYVALTNVGLTSPFEVDPAQFLEEQVKRVTAMGQDKVAVEVMRALQYPKIGYDSYTKKLTKSLVVKEYD